MKKNFGKEYDREKLRPRRILYFPLLLYYNKKLRKHGENRFKFNNMKKHIVWHILLIFYLSFIYFNSLTPAALSSQESGAVLRLLHSVLGEIGLSAPWLTEHVVRKCAHFGEYFILGMLLTQSLNCTKLKGQGRIFGQIALMTVFPLIDETLQLFTPGRSGQISDVWLDMGGTAAGALLFLAAALAFRRTRNNTVFKNQRQQCE